MKNIQIEKVILWSKGEDVKVEQIDFVTGKLNIIYGASQTGKSAIIPIIDYCLCSTENKIPVGVIRNKCSWFGIKLKIDDSEIIIARENRDKAARELYYDEGVNIEIPKIPFNNYRLEELKTTLNDMIGVSFYETNDFQHRPSFRDLVSFNFQTQNIIANPNCLLYKSDIAQYRDRIKAIFDFAIGAETSTDLKNKTEKRALQDELDKLLKLQQQEEKFNKTQLDDNKDLLLNAARYGLISEKDIDLSSEYKVLKSFEHLSKKTIYDINPSFASITKISEELSKLNKEISPLSLTLRKLEKEQNDVNEIVELQKEYINLLETKRDKLKIAEFVREFCIKNPKDTSIIEDVNKLCATLEEIELSLNTNIENENSMYDSKLSSIQKSIEITTSEITRLVRRKDNLEKIEETKKFLEEIYENILVKSKMVIERYKYKDEDLNVKISNLERKIGKIFFKSKQEDCLNSIVEYTREYLPSFAEFKYIDEFDVNNLTLKIKESPLSNSFYLWGAGSGSNWVAYHLAVMLGLHKHFINKSTPVFNFLILDQPSQVYFPKAKYNETTKTFELVDNDDFNKVKEMFKLLSTAVKDNNDKLQIIVLDHAGEDIWGDLEDYNISGHWVNGTALVPQNW